MAKNGGISIESIMSNPTNILKLLSGEACEQILQYCDQRFEHIKMLRTDRNEALAEANKEALQIYEPKNHPWQGASNVKYPLITNTSIDFAARIFPAVWQDGDVVKTKYYTKHKNFSVGARQATYLNYQLREKIPGWETSLDKLCSAYPVNGLMLKKVFYDPEIESVRSELVYPQDFYIPNDAPSIESAECYFHRYTKDRNTIISNLRSGLYSGVDEDCVVEENPGDDDTEVTNATVRESDKVKDMHSSMYEVVEGYVWLDLDKDGYSEPYVVHWLPKLRSIVRIAPRYESRDINFNDKKQVIKITAMQFFVRFPFWESLDGSLYGLGLGELLLPLNKAVDASINQLVDAGTLNNMNSGWMSKSLRLSQGDNKFKPGEWKTVNSYMGKLSENILPNPKSEPSQTTFNLLGMLKAAGEDIGGAAKVKDITLPSNISALSGLALIENGMMPLKAVYKRFHRALSEEMELIWYWLARYPDMNEYIEVVGQPVDEEGKPDDNWAPDQDFQITKATVPVSDPNLITTISKASKAEQLMQLMRMGGTLDPTKTTIQILDLMDVDPSDVIKTEMTPADQMNVKIEGAKLDLIKSEVLKNLAQAARAKDQGVGDLARANSETFARVGRAMGDLRNAALTKVPVWKPDGTMANVEVTDTSQFIDEIKALAGAANIMFESPIGSLLNDKIKQSIPESVEGVENKSPDTVQAFIDQMDGAGLAGPKN